MVLFYRMTKFKVVLLLLLIVQTSQSEHPFYEAEEGSNFTVEWLGLTKMDLSKLHMNCLLMTEPAKTMLDVLWGEETPEAQDAQFSGRLQVDTEALKLGQVRLRLSNLTTLDSGTYRCEMAAELDSGDWGLISTKYFELKVAPKVVMARGTSHVNNEIPSAGLAPAALRHDPVTAAVVIVLALIIAPFFVIVVMLLMRQFYR